MEKKPKSVPFAVCKTCVKFDTVLDQIICVKEHYDEDGNLLSIDSVKFNLTVMPFQTAMSMACEYVRSVALIEYEEGK